MFLYLGVSTAGNFFLGYNYTSIIKMRYEEIEGSNMKIGQGVGTIYMKTD